jgi:hypothetical protein
MVLKNGQGNNWNNLIENVSIIVKSARSYNYGQVTKELKNFIPEYIPDSKTTQQRLKSSLIEES